MPDFLYEERVRLLFKLYIYIYIYSVEILCNKKYRGKMKQRINFHIIEHSVQSNLRPLYGIFNGGQV